MSWFNQYEFDEQPTMLRRVDPLRAEPKQGAGTMAVATMVEVMSLSEVTAKFPTSRLLCFADPMTCFDPLTGKIRPWVETLEAWEERFLFTTSTHGQWTQAERILSRRGFQVIPLSHLGLQLFSQLLEQGSPSSVTATVPDRERGGIYDRRPERWLERHPPSQETITRVLDDLRKELGQDGMCWLAACAAYPEIHWALTLEWGVRLFGSGHIAESLLPKLTPLIWFRHAFMPDWFRMALYDQLTAQQADRISQELGDIISALNPERDDVLQLYIATQPGAKQEAPAPAGRFSTWLQKLRRRLAIQEMGRAADPGSPMRDYVMLQYLSGKQGKALAPYAPKPLLELLFPKGQPWLGFRPAFLIMAAGLVSSGLWWWLDPAPKPVSSPIREVGFLPDTNEIVVKRASGRYERWGREGQALGLLESGEEGAFADRLRQVKMGQITLSDPTNVFNLTYQKEGLVRLTIREDEREVAQIAVPPSPAASLHWPSDAEPFLAVAPGEGPELLILNGLAELRQQELARMDKEKSAKVAANRMAEAQRQADSAKKKQLAAQAEAVRKKAAKEAEQEAERQRQAEQRQDAKGEVPKPSGPPEQKEPELQQAIKAPNVGDTSQGSTATAGPERNTKQAGAGQLPKVPIPQITGKDGAPMVLILAGEFTMGSPQDDGMAERDERPAHSVYLDAYYLDQYEVTTARYAKFFQETNRAAPQYWSEQVLKQHGRKPVVGVNWNDATAYCAWAGKRLPTEAEWEKAARGSDQRLYPWGNAAPTQQRANFNHCCDFKDYGVLSDVGSFEEGKSPYGVYDMAGNVWEWTADWYDEYYYDKSPERNPTGPSLGEYRVLRGGSWSGEPQLVRSAARGGAQPVVRDAIVGFRCAQDAR